MFHKLYEEQPASPLIEWFRYANRRAKDLKRWPKRAKEHAAATLTIFGLTQFLRGREAAIDDLIALIIAALASVLVVPAGQWLFYFATAFHGLLKDDCARLEKDNVALLEELMAAKRKAEEVSIIITNHLMLPEAGKIAIQGHPPAVVVEPFTDALKKEGSKRLAALRETAIHELLNRKITSEDQLASLKRDIEGWERQVLAALEQFAQVDEVSTFRVLGTYSTRVTGGINAEHNRELAMLGERLKRLLKVITRLSS